MKIPITEETKKQLLENSFFYEVERMREYIHHLYPVDGKVLNVVLEGFLLHIRNLYEFFYGSGKGDKAHAGNYERGWKNKKPHADTEYWNIQLNHFLSHLSYGRVNRQHQPYPVFELYAHYGGLVIDFLGGLEEKYKTPRLIELMESLKREVEINQKTEEMVMKCVDCKEIIDPKDKWVGLGGDYWHTRCLKQSYENTLKDIKKG